VKIIPLALLGSVLTLIMTAGLAPGQALSHGPVVGGVTDGDANVFVRTDKAATVQLRYSTDPRFATYLTSDSFTTAVANDFTKIIVIGGLTAETTYYLDVTVNNIPQLVAPYPSFKTFPPVGSAKNFTFLVMTDFTTTFRIDGPTAAFASAAATNPAFVFIGGDFDHRNPDTLKKKRTMFHDLYNAGDPYMGEFVNLILRKFPIVHQWDDHDAGDNNVDRTYANWSLTQQVFQEYVPTYPLPAVTPGIWQKFNYAQADFFVLDCRSQRDPEKDRDDSTKSMLDGNNLGSRGQLQWLENGLLASTARWKVIFTSVVTNFTTKFPDGWSGYQTEWDVLRNYIHSNNIQGVFFISGDLHLGAIDNGTLTGFPEMCVEQPNGEGFCPTFNHGSWSEGYYDDRSCKGFSLVTFATNPDKVTLQVLDQFGDTKISYSFGDGIPTPTPTPMPVPPVITAQPRDTTVSVGQQANFQVTATGTAPLWYQWQKNGADIHGAMFSNYRTPPATAADNGSVFDVVVSDCLGTVTSAGATLTVTSSVSPDSPGPTAKNDAPAVGLSWVFWLERPSAARPGDTPPLRRQ
jgi:alkaline phosphatase D